MKTFTLTYSVTTHYDTIVHAKDRNAAIAKVKEVIGEPVEIENVWEHKNANVRNARTSKH